MAGLKTGLFYVSVTPNAPPLHYNVAVALKARCRFDEAISCFRRVLLVKPDDIGAHYGLGAAYPAFGDSNSALEEYKILKTLDVEQANKLLKLIGK